MRNIPNSGYYLRPTFLQPLCCPVTHLSVYLLFLFGGIASHTSRLFMSNPFLSVCLSPLCLPLGHYPRIFSHPNVLPMLGACQSPPAPHPIIITHWMPYGSLYNVLHEGTSEYDYSSCRTVCACHRFFCVWQGFVIYWTFAFVIMLPSFFCTAAISLSPVMWWRVAETCSWFVSHPVFRLCGGPDTGGEVCAGHCLWNGLLTHTW